MASAPPPYSPYNQDPRLLKYQRRMLRDQARAQARIQRDQIRFQSQAMRRSSLLGPILAISVGIIFLLVEIGRLSSTRLWTWYGRWWPLLLVLAGAVLLAEWVVDRFVPNPAGQPYGRRSAAGAITLILLLALAGAVLQQSGDFRNLAVNGFSINPDNVAEIFGSRHESDQTLDVAFPIQGALSIDVPHGDITVTGTSTDGRIHLAVHKQVYSNSDTGAEQEAREFSPQVATSGRSVTIAIPSRGGASADLNLTIPAAATLTLNANHGDIRVDDTTGALSITANHGDIALASVSGNVISHVNNNSSSFSAHKVNGSVSLEGHAEDLTLSDIAGPVDLSGDFYGTTHLEHVAGAIHFHTSRTDFQLARLDGQIEIGSEEISADQLAGPVVLTTRNRNLRLERVAGQLSVTNRNGTVDLSAAPPLGNITVQNRDGGVTLSLPGTAGFSLNATTEDGSVENDFSLSSVDHEHRSVLNGTVGKGGPLVRIDNNHGDIAVRRADVGPLTPLPIQPPVPPTLPANPSASSFRKGTGSKVSIGRDGVQIVSGEDGSSVSVSANGVQVSAHPR